jgi:hypothetical protein
VSFRVSAKSLTFSDPKNSFLFVSRCNASLLDCGRSRQHGSVLVAKSRRTNEVEPRSAGRSDASVLAGLAGIGGEPDGLARSIGIK